MQHSIPTGNAAPVRERYRQIPPKLYQEVKSLIQGMLDANIIVPSCSPWASPIVLVRKKDGTLRFCVDYRKLNAVTHKDAYPLPRIEESLASLGNAKYFSTLDLASGYWQVEVSPPDREKTAFTTPMGLFEFTRMPFGLSNAPATFQRLMHVCVREENLQSVLVYLDDVIIYSPDFDTHLIHLDAVLGKLSKHGLKLKPKKCCLLKPEVQYLGHRVSAKGIAPDPDKIKCIQEWPIPTTVKQLQSFLGLAGYYRRFVKDFARIAQPLNQILVGASQNSKRKDVPLSSKWNPTYASNQGLGAVLAQVQDGKERVIAFASRSLSPSEKNDKNYSSFKLEFLALTRAVTKKFAEYLPGPNICHSLKAAELQRLE
ncbi:thy-1 membrane glycoprotein [Pelmatolapia mariae]|uniref:thy-1 membrane glycoprotein n=1 Tax=Pelmatolapia mariae TaxID=158779 RepID=UPI002FE5DDD7